LHDLTKIVDAIFRIVGLFSAFSASVFLTSCATGQIDLTAGASTGDVATITGDRKFVYLFFYIYHLECGIIQADSTSVAKLIGAKSVTVPEGMHRLSVNCKIGNPDKKMLGSDFQTYEGDLSFFAQAGHDYTVGLKGSCIVVIDHANEAIVKSDCEPSIRY
jgi:hypothetical protein